MELCCDVEAGMHARHRGEMHIISHDRLMRELCCRSGISDIGPMGSFFIRRSNAKPSSTSIIMPEFLPDPS